MAMNSSQLASEILDALESAGLQPRNPKASGIPEAMWTAVASAIVSHIESNAQVVIPGGSSSGTYPII